MSVDRTAWRSADQVRRPGSAAPRSPAARWLLRIVRGLVATAASWILYCAGSAFFDRGAMTVPARRTDLTISVTGDATVESRSNLDIKSQVRGLQSILEIVPEGTIVAPGDPLVRLDSTAVDEAIKAQKLVLGKAEAALIRATKEWQAAKIAVDEYAEGTFVQRRLELTQNILHAQQRLAKTERSLLQNEIMFRKGFASHHHVDAMQLAVDKARTDLAAAKTKKEVLEDFTRAKKLEELAALRDAAEARRKSQEVIVRRQAAKIKRLEDDAKHCLIRAPRAGMVVYANTTARGPDGVNQRVVQIHPGARVRQYQTLVRLADVNQMQLRMFVPENKVRQLRRGQPARARLLDVQLRGEIASIADQPEIPSLPGNAPKQFAVIITSDGARGLKPGMTAEVEIVLQQKKQAIVIPALCVSEEKGKPRVRVKTWSGVSSREVMLGIGDDALVEVLDGVKERELVVLVPRS